VKNRHLNLRKAIESKRYVPSPRWKVSWVVALPIVRRTWKRAGIADELIIKQTLHFEIILCNLQGFCIFAIKLLYND